MTMHDGGHYSMSILWTQRIFAFMEQECYLHQIVNQIPKIDPMDRLYPFN